MASAAMAVISASARSDELQRLSRRPSASHRTSGHGQLPRFRIVQRLHEASPNARVYVCEDQARSTTETSAQSELVVVKIAQCSLPQTSASCSRVVVPQGPERPALELCVGADSIQQELAVAKLLLESVSPHPHIVQYHSVTSRGHRTDQSTGLDGDDTVMLVMEYCSGGDLFSLLEQQPDLRFHEAHALSLFRQIVSGVHHLHTLGIAHLDISLENVLLDAHGHAKICDFGLSVFFDETEEQRTTSTGPVGKLQFMAPEVAAGGTYDPVCADVWSLGMVLFVMVTGSPLFQVALPSDAAWNAVEKVGIRGILSHWELGDVLSGGTVDLLASMLQLDPVQRPQSLESVLTELTVS